MERAFWFRYGEEKAGALIPQAGVKLAAPVGYRGYNCCWDGTLSPDGTFYFSLGSENGEGGYAFLNRYNERENRIEPCFYTRDVVLPSPRALPGSKIHSAIDFLPDGRIICCNHTTDRAPGHPEWLPYAYYGHPWEGFQGSTLMIYDPRTGHAENLGIPAPHESMYGGVYDRAHNAYFMLGYQRGHMFRYDLESRSVLDLGKAVETCSHRLHVGPDGHVYATSPSGFFFRVRTDTNRIEWTGIRLAKHRSDYSRRFVYRYISTYLDLDDRRMLMIGGYSNHLFEYDTRSCELRDYGEMQGAREMFEGFGNYFYCFNGDLDSDGVLWYAMTPRLMDPPEAYRAQTNPAPAYLFRWDYRRGREAELLGVMGVPGLACGLISEVRIDRSRDVLFASCAADKDNGPPVMCIDLAQQRAHAGERGPAHGDRRFVPVPKTEDGKRGAEYEGTSLENAHEAFSPEQVTQARLWTEIPGDMENAAVRGLFWEDAHTVRGVAGADAPRYAFTIRDARVTAVEPWESLEPDAREALLRRACPEITPVGAVLPAVAGRQYLAVPSCTVPWNGGRTLVGTKDGKLAVVDGGAVFSLGLTSGSGPVRALCTNAEKTLAWCAAGDAWDIGKLFTYDDRKGLCERGMLRWICHGEDCVVGADVLTAVALSPDGTKLAVGSGDLTATVYIVTL